MLITVLILSSIALFLIIHFVLSTILSIDEVEKKLATAREDRKSYLSAINGSFPAMNKCAIESQNNHIDKINREICKLEIKLQDLKM